METILKADGPLEPGDAIAYDPESDSVRKLPKQQDTETIFSAQHGQIIVTLLDGKTVDAKSVTFHAATRKRNGLAAAVKSIELWDESTLLMTGLGVPAVTIEAQRHEV